MPPTPASQLQPDDLVRFPSDTVFTVREVNALGPALVVITLALHRLHNEPVEVI